MAKKYYAVKKGLTPGIYTDWDTCKNQVHNFPGAIYKSFKTLEEAHAFLGNDTFIPIENDAVTEEVISQPVVSIVAPEPKPCSYLSLPDDEIVAYVDGSYNNDTTEFSYGAVIFYQGKEHHLSEKSSNPSLASMRNVAGEIKGSEAAISFALEHKARKITIYHDYEGIAKWCTGGWKTNKEGTISYKAFYDEASKNVDISFVKVTGHSGDKYNDLADSLAKQALGLE